MKLDINLISGVMVGFELVDDYEEDYSYVVIDLFIIRIVLSRDLRE